MNWVTLFTWKQRSDWAQSFPIGPLLCGCLRLGELADPPSQTTSFYRLREYFEGFHE